MVMVSGPSDLITAPNKLARPDLSVVLSTNTHSHQLVLDSSDL